MDSRAVEFPPMCFRADVASADDATRSVELVFTTGAAVERVDWWTGKRYLEKLSLDPAHIRLDRLNTGAPLLDAHSAFSIADQIGTVVPGSVKLTKSEGRATVRFSKRDAVTPIWNDVKDGIIRNVSTGYRVRKYEEEQGKNEIAVRTAVDWEPYEISMVPMPADAGAQVRGERPMTQLYPCLIELRSSDADRMRRLRLAMARS